MDQEFKFNDTLIHRNPIPRYEVIVKNKLDREEEAESLKEDERIPFNGIYIYTHSVGNTDFYTHEGQKQRVKGCHVQTNKPYNRLFNVFEGPEYWQFRTTDEVVTTVYEGTPIPGTPSVIFDCYISRLSGVSNYGTLIVKRLENGEWLPMASGSQ